MTALEMNVNFLKAALSDGIGGNYLLSEGVVSESGRYYVSYVGRTGDLKRRLIEHLDDEYKYIRAWIVEEPDEIKRYLSECNDYHTYSSVMPLRNKVHPSRPEGCNLKCPVCGE